MKAFSYIILILLTTSVISCNKKEMLNVTPKDQLTGEIVWSDPVNADLFLNDVYNQLPDIFNHADALDSWADNSTCGHFYVGSIRIISTGLVLPTSTYDNGGNLLDWMEYNKNYANIRKCNVFIKNVSASTLSDDYKKERLAEARFLRAKFYQILWMTYGGVPIITNVLNKSEQGDSIYHSRNTFEETFEFIRKQCDSAAMDLPLAWNSSDMGRATQGAALALKGWCELFAASPAFNSNNPPEGNNTLVNFGNYNLTRWKDAAETNKKIMDLHLYSLYPDYGSLFFNDHNQEIIFARQYVAVAKGGKWEGYMGTTYVRGAELAWGGVNPTQDLVDDYEMDNGKPIADPTSGYDPQQPYKHREKRFYQSIVYDGSVWQQDTIWTRKGIGSPNEIDLTNRDDAGQTGYYLRKMIDEGINGAENLATGNAGHDFIFSRYGEVLLNYAEAQNEMMGPDQSVYDAINKIRTRSDLPGLAAGLTQSQMRQTIHRERRVELAFEEKRWWDVIRWGIADSVLNKPIHGMLIEKVAGKWTYNIIPIQNKVFVSTKHYVLPIPQNVIDQNPKIKQNPGY